jgi:glycosyltransferase involved in cell wall biosynthesis
MKIAIVHEWLQNYAGSERVLEQLLECYPDADLFAVVDFMPDSERRFLKGRRVTTSFIQKLPLARRFFRLFLPLMPVAVEQFDMAPYDLVISSSHAVAKGVITGPNQVHVSYVYSPMRYAWDLQAQYLRQARLERGLKSAYARWTLHKMRMWDVRTANGVDMFIACSSYIAARIRKVYRREARVIHPPVDIVSFVPGGTRGGSYLIVSRFVPYKRVDLVAGAFARMPERRLVIVGDGPDREVVRAAAHGAPNVEFRPPLEKAELIRLMQSARAFVFPAEEDFGITMVEALACGTPVIAFDRGGARDIVEDGRTGVLFGEQTREAIEAAVERFERLTPTIDPDECAESAKRFGQESFRLRIVAAMGEVVSFPLPVPGYEHV